MRSKRNKAGYTAISKKCKYCGGGFCAAKKDALYCSPKCRKAKHLEKERVAKGLEEKRLLQKGIFLKKLTEDRADLLVNMRELIRVIKDAKKCYEDSLTDQRPEAVNVYQELILLHFNSIRKLVDYCEDDFLKSEVIGNDFNYQMWDILEGRTFEREDESQAWDDDETEIQA